jgi:hypothetical protein
LKIPRPLAISIGGLKSGEKPTISITFSLDEKLEELLAVVFAPDLPVVVYGDASADDSPRKRRDAVADAASRTKQVS